mgnify:CR=1 FL=1
MKYINWEKNSGYNKGYNTNKLIAEKNYKSSSNTIVKAYTQIQESGVLEILKNITNIRKIFSIVLAALILCLYPTFIIFVLKFFDFA